MEVVLLPSTSADRGQSGLQFLSTYLVNRVVALDAGSLGFAPSLEEQLQIRHVLLTHAHLDHVGSIPIFLENIDYGRASDVAFHASQEVFDSLRRDMFNDRLWPDLLNLPPPGLPFPAMKVLEPGRPIEAADLRVTAVPVEHVVPTFAFLVEDRETAFILATDTGPSHQIWDLANRTPNLRAVFLDCAFPNELGWLAQTSLHLTPELFAREMAKVRTAVPYIAIHLKPGFYADIVRELRFLQLPNLEIVEPGRTYSF